MGEKEKKGAAIHYSYVVLWDLGELLQYKIYSHCCNTLFRMCYTASNWHFEPQASGEGKGGRIGVQTADTYTGCFRNSAACRKDVVFTHEAKTFFPASAIDATVAVLKTYQSAPGGLLFPVPGCRGSSWSLRQVCIGGGDCRLSRGC